MMEFPVHQRMDEIATAPDRDAVWCPHVTVACVIADGDRFLMVEEEVRGVRQFNQPAGHLEPHETLVDAALRETLEETGWEVALDHFVGVQQWYSPVHDHQIVRFAFAGHTVRHHPERQLDAGIVRAAWMPYAEIAALGERLRSPLVLATLDDWLAGQRLSLATLRSRLPDGA